MCKTNDSAAGLNIDYSMKFPVTLIYVTALAERSKVNLFTAIDLFVCLFDFILSVKQGWVFLG